MMVYKLSLKLKEPYLEAMVPELVSSVSGWGTSASQGVARFGQHARCGRSSHAPSAQRRGRGRHVVDILRNVGV